MKINPNQIKRILLVRLSALGDCVAAIPTFLALRDHFPQAHIAWIIQDNFSPLIRNLPGLDEIIIFPRQRWKKTHSWTTLIQEGSRLNRHLRLRKFDVTIDVQSNTKSAVLAFLTRAPIRIGHGPEEAKELSMWFNQRGVDYPAEMKHIVRRNRHLLSALGIPDEEPRFSLPVDARARAIIDTWLQSKGLQGSDYTLLFPFCGGREKEWPVERYTALAEGLARSGKTVIVGCGPGEEERAIHLLPASYREAVQLGPRTDILELVELIRSAQTCVGGDTGPLQMAGALNVPNIAIFGPTAPERSHPWSNCRVKPIDSSPQLILDAIQP